MKKIIPLIIGVLFSFTLSAQTLLDEAVDINVKDVNGQVFSLFEILDSGKHVVIDFYSTSCGYCQIYAPHVQASYEHFGENSGDVFFMTIDKGHNNAEVVAFDEEYGITMPSVSGTEGNGNQAHLAFEIQATPSVILIAPDYTIIEQMIWLPTTENIDQALLNAGLMMVGINEPEIQPFSFYPNPANSILKVDFGEDITNGVISIMNMTGQFVEETIVNSNHLSINVSNFPEGIYFIRLDQNNGIQYTERILISR
jgi:thiol-disulfide isomerase/thioredoxin